MAQELSSVLSSVDLIVLGDAVADGESVASLSTNNAHKYQPLADSSNIAEDHNKNTSQSPSNNVNEDIPLESPEHFIVDKTPPQNRKKRKLVPADSLGI